MTYESWTQLFVTFSPLMTHHRFRVFRFYLTGVEIKHIYEDPIQKQRPFDGTGIISILISDYIVTSTVDIEHETSNVRQLLNVCPQFFKIVLIVKNNGW